jgi:hypothetical protein
LPGSGKSSWFKRHNITPLSSDMLRSLLFDDPTEQRFQDLIFSNLRSMLKARLIARRPICSSPISIPASVSRPYLAAISTRRRATRPGVS